MLDLSDDGVAALKALPFAPGTSPFRVKGTAYRGHLDYVARVLPPGLERMLAKTDDPQMTAFYRQHFLASSLYDVFPLAWAGVVCAQLAGVPYLDFVRKRTLDQARNDLGGIYRVILALASPNAVAQRLPGLVGQYFDFGSAHVEKDERGHVIVARTGVPVPLVPWYEAVTDAYCGVVLSRAGAKNLRLGTRRVLAVAKHGIPTMDLYFDMQFDR